MQAWCRLCDCRRWERVGMCAIGDWFEFGSSSPSLNCPQKAVDAQARTATSKGDLGSKLSWRSLIMALFIGIRGGRVDEGGEQRDTPFRT